MNQPPSSLGTPAVRADGRAKVTGAARYAAEHTPPGCAYAWPVPATIASGRVTAVHADEALALPGVVTVLTHENAPRLTPGDEPILLVLQDACVPHSGWFVALVVADTLEAARAGARAVRVEYETDPHDVLLHAGHAGIKQPAEANGGFPADRERGDFATAFAEAQVRVDATYTMTPLHNHPMEPHAAVAHWHEGHLTVHDSSQGATAVRTALAGLFDRPEETITVISEYVGGGFGSKGTPRPQCVLAAMAAREIGRPVKLSLPRGQLPAVVGHRAPTLNRLRLGAAQDGVIAALAHEVLTYTSRIKEFVEQAAVPARIMYHSPHSLTTHRVAPLDVSSPSWMRAPGEASGMYALESAMDELARAAGVDPVELRIRNEPSTDPDSGRRFSSRNLVACLREGAERFGWAARDPRPGVRREGALLVGTGVAAATYPVLVSPSKAEVLALPDGTFLVRTNATDIGTGARTVLAQIAADALRAPLDSVRMEIGDSDLPAAPLAGGSSGTASWGWAVHQACTELLELLGEYGGEIPPGGLGASADTDQQTNTDDAYSRHAFGAHFAEVQVDTATGEVRTRRLLGVYAAGHVLNPRTARSQFIGGMIMGLGMALTEGSTIDAASGAFIESDLASYHVPACADTPEIEAHWIDEDDTHLNPMGSKGIGEIGNVGTAAAIGNAVYHATGVRFRHLPITPDKVLNGLE
ncbi:xanthine dehydrogenase family protein molybdopterin-binding subunit [Streptomyces tsukubensis]|uniref:Xanthine dehydrogenase n=1 Tax=Streptomyces tsukubensis TaxID=83656 RepID=A0A1V4A0E6_9ACTN|nr:xanthine dehydrogenase family protein molybdopterin-binding subunit [Streptomyces tsukubensis]OON72192.1 xanthine dehydrogenase [Streptomyces tsukubensis]QFR97073.1 molybdopterin-dependent oxidoreductase [Streptomyces tsukubensis]